MSEEDLTEEWEAAYESRGGDSKAGDGRPKHPYLFVGTEGRKPHSALSFMYRKPNSNDAMFFGSQLIFWRSSINNIGRFTAIDGFAPQPATKSCGASRERRAYQCAIPPLERLFDGFAPLYSLSCTGRRFGGMFWADGTEEGTFSLQRAIFRVHTDSSKETHGNSDRSKDELVGGELTKKCAGAEQSKTASFGEALTPNRRVIKTSNHFAAFFSHPRPDSAAVRVSHTSQPPWPTWDQKLGPKTISATTLRRILEEFFCSMCSE